MGEHGRGLLRGLQQRGGRTGGQWGGRQACMRGAWGSPDTAHADAPLPPASRGHGPGPVQDTARAGQVREAREQPGDRQLGRHPAWGSTPRDCAATRPTAAHAAATPPSTPSHSTRPWQGPQPVLQARRTPPLPPLRHPLACSPPSALLPPTPNTRAVNASHAQSFPRPLCSHLLPPTPPSLAWPLHPAPNTTSW